MSKKKPRTPLGRALRRKQSRITAKEEATLHAALEVLPGGTAERPLRVDSASVIEPRASREACAYCGGDVAVVEHRARTVAAQRLRQVQVRCRGCGRMRTLWFALPEAVLH